MARASEELEIPVVDRRTVKERDHRCDGEVRPERYRHLLLMPREDDERDADYGTDERRKQDDQGQRFPPEPGADRRKQLEVAVAHAILARCQFVKPEDRPQHEITGCRADHRRPEIGKDAKDVENEAGPQQKERNAVRQIKRVEVDEGKCHHRPAEEERAQCRGTEPEAPGHIAAQESRQCFYEGIARRNARLARRTPATKHEVTYKRNIFACRDRVAAGGTPGTRQHEIVTLFRWGLSTGELRTFRAPLPFEDARQPVDHHIEKAADTETNNNRNDGEVLRIAQKTQRHAPWPPSMRALSAEDDEMTGYTSSRGKHRDRGRHDRPRSGRRIL